MKKTIFEVSKAKCSARSINNLFVFLSSTLSVDPLPIRKPEILFKNAFHHRNLKAKKK